MFLLLLNTLSMKHENGSNHCRHTHLHTISWQTLHWPKLYSTNSNQFVFVEWKTYIGLFICIKSLNESHVHSLVETLGPLLFLRSLFLLYVYVILDSGDWISGWCQQVFRLKLAKKFKYVLRSNWSKCVPAQRNIYKFTVCTHVDKSSCENKRTHQL